MTQPSIPTRISVFDENNPKYKCCGRISVRTGAVIIAGLNVLGVVGVSWNFFSNLTMINSGPYGSTRFAITLSFLVLEIIALFCLIIAFHSERPKFVMPQIFIYALYVIFQVIIFQVIVVMSAISGLGNFYAMISNTENGGGPDILSIVIGILIIVINISIGLWFLRTLFAYYVYLCDKMRFRNSVAIDGAADGMEPMVGQKPPAETGMQTKSPDYQEAMNRELRETGEMACLNRNSQ